MKTLDLPTHTIPDPRVSRGRCATFRLFALLIALLVVGPARIVVAATEEAPSDGEILEIRLAPADYLIANKARVVGIGYEGASPYYDLVLQAINDTVRRRLEELMRSGNYTFQSEFAKKYVAEGRKKGRKEGRKEGREEGQIEGRVDSAIKSLLKVLEARGLEVSDAQLKTIKSCNDPATLEGWFDRALGSKTANEVFEESE